MAMIIKPKDVGWQLRVFLEAMRPPPTPMQHTFALKFTLINHMTLSLSITKGEARNRLVRIVCIHSATIICQNGTKLCRLVTVT